MELQEQVLPLLANPSVPNICMPVLYFSLLEMSINLILAGMRKLLFIRLLDPIGDDFFTIPNN